MQDTPRNTPDGDGHSPFQFDGVVTRAPVDSRNDTAQPSLTSGFGAVIEKELALQSATEGSLGQVSGHRSAQADRVLRHQHAQLRANIALLEQRYEALPHVATPKLVFKGHARATRWLRGEGRLSGTSGSIAATASPPLLRLSGD